MITTDTAIIKNKDGLFDKHYSLKEWECTKEEIENYVTDVLGYSPSLDVIEWSDLTDDQQRECKEYYI